jgi:Leucine-rich repeat (LRR) protein
MDIHHDAVMSKPHPTAAPTAHAGLHATHRAPSAGSLRQRGNSKRNQNHKAKKNDGSDAFKADSSAHGSAVQQRLAIALRTKRLDLSLPRQTQAPPEPPVRSQHLRIQPLQIFPAMVIDHANRGHHLTELWLTNHHLGSLPTEITVFTQLRVLGLAGNALTALPDDLSQLTSLEALFLEKNRLQTLPSRMAFPPHLRELRLDHNQLALFPVQITKLRLLNRLGISHNQLKVLPEQLHRLRNLVELDLDYNRLDTDLPEGFAALQRLERLGLEGNFFEERPAILDRLPVLSYIRLSGNRSKQFLSATGLISIGSTRQLLAVPKRHDGYFQCVERGGGASSSKDEGINDPQSTSNLEGLVLCRDQNLLNAVAYDAHPTSFRKESSAA